MLKDAKIEIYDDPSFGFKKHTYWGGGFKTVLYLQLALSRPSFDVFQNINEDQLQNQEVVYQRSIPTYSVPLLYITPLLDQMQRIGFHDFVDLTFLDTAETFTLRNVNFEDEGDAADTLTPSRLTFQLVPVADTNCANTEYSVIVCP